MDHITALHRCYGERQGFVQFRYVSVMAGLTQACAGARQGSLKSASFDRLISNETRLFPKAPLR
jgi:hypothetical protein